MRCKLIILFEKAILFSSIINHNCFISHVSVITMA